MYFISIVCTHASLKDIYFEFSFFCSHLHFLSNLSHVLVSVGFSVNHMIHIHSWCFYEKWISIFDLFIYSWCAITFNIQQSIQIYTCAFDFVCHLSIPGALFSYHGSSVQLLNWKKHLRTRKIWSSISPINLFLSATKLSKKEEIFKLEFHVHLSRTKPLSVQHT